MKSGGLISHHDCGELIAETLRLFVGQGRRLSWADLAAATGDDEAKLRSYVRTPPVAMPLDVFLRVMPVLPPAAFARVALRLGFSAAPVDAEDAASLRHAMAEASRFVADGSEALEDGALSPRERAQIQRKAEALLPTIQAVANGETVQ